MEVSVPRDTDTHVTHFMDDIVEIRDPYCQYALAAQYPQYGEGACTMDGSLRRHLESRINAIIDAQYHHSGEGACMMDGSLRRHLESRINAIIDAQYHHSGAGACMMDGSLDDELLQESQTVRRSLGSIFKYVYKLDTPGIPLSGACRAAFHNLQVEARRGILSKILDSVAVDKVVSETRSRIEKCPVFEDDIKRIRECFDDIEKTFAPLANDLRKVYAVVVAAVVLLSYVYRYLTGCGGWDGSKAESSGSLDYRDTYISIVLFQGAYVWIKFRDVASTKPVPKGAVRILPIKDGRTRVKYEPRFKPRKENGISFNWIYLGQFDSYTDAEVVYRMAASCYEYGKCYGTPVDLAGDGHEFFTIIPELTPDEQSLSGREKQELVKVRVKEVYKFYKEKKDALNLPQTLHGANLEKELQNGCLQLEVLMKQQQKEDVVCQLHQSQHLQQAQQFQIQNLQLQVQNLQLQLQDLQQAQQFQVENLQLQLQHLQHQQREAQSCPFDEFCDGLLVTEPIPEDLAGFGASINFGGYRTDG